MARADTFRTFELADEALGETLLNVLYVATYATKRVGNLMHFYGTIRILLASRTLMLRNKCRISLQ